MKVLYFARARELAGCAEETWAVEKLEDVEAFWVEAVARHPALAEWRAACRVAVNQEYVDETCPIRAGDEVAVIPPVSGG